jgi:hypothetical protein
MKDCMFKDFFPQGIGFAQVAKYLVIAFGLSICFVAGQLAWDAVFALF